MKPTCVKLRRGAANIKDRIGYRKGMLTVVECVESADRHKLGGMWKCACDCGGEKIVPGRDLRPGCKAPSSCGCNRGPATAKGALTRGRNPRRASLNMQYHSYTSSRKKHGGGTLMTLEEWSMIALLPCHYCGGTDIRRRTSTKALGGKYIKVTQAEIDAYDIAVNGIDRVDVSRGYESDNMVPCCAMCNRMKSYYEMDDFLDKVKDLYEHQHLEMRPKREEPFRCDSPSTYRSTPQQGHDTVDVS